MKVLNFGSCNIDYVYSVENFVNAGETIAVKKMEIFPGGKGLNQSVAAARAGATVYHAGCIGDDGEILKSTLKMSGADVSFLKSMEEKSGHAIIQVDSSGENCIMVFEGTNGAIKKEFADEVLANFSSDDFLLVQNETNCVSYIIDEAFKKGMKTVFNPSPFNERINEVNLEHISYLLVNQTEAKEISGGKTQEEFFDILLSKYPNLKIVFTLGAKGCVYADKNTTISQEAYKTEVVDTTAAGDTFSGYFVAQIAEGRSVKEAIKCASMAASVSVSRMGAAPSIPKMEEVKERLEKLV